MEQFNIKHLFDGELIPLNLGNMTLSAALYTAYHMQDENNFTMVVFNIEDKHFLATGIMGRTVFFDYNISNGDLDIIPGIEDRLIDIAEKYSSNTITVKVYREYEQYDKEIDKILEPLGKLEMYERYMSSMIDSYNKQTNTPRLEAIEYEEDEQDYEIVDEIRFDNIEAFDDKDEIFLDADNEAVAEILEDVTDIDDEISELKEIAKDMLEEAAFISEHGYHPADDEYYYDDKFTDEDFEDVDKDYPYYVAKEKELYWDTTLEEDEKFGITKNEKDVSKMNNNSSNVHDAEFNERLENMLEYMLTQSSVGHEPNYKFEHTKQGEKQEIPKFSNKYGKFLIDDVTDETVFDGSSHIIRLRVKTTNPKTGETQVVIEESELMNDFTIKEVITEVGYNSSKMPHSDVELYTMEKVDGTVLWVAHPKK